MCANLPSLEKENRALPEHQYPIRFAIRSLGWVPIAEDDLSQEKSSRAVNKCIVDFSSGKRDINDVVGRWGDVSTLYIYISACLCLCVCMWTCVHMYVVHIIWNFIQIVFLTSILWFFIWFVWCVQIVIYKWREKQVIWDGN